VDEPPLTAVRNGIVDALRVVIADDETLIRDRLGVMLSVPAIRARMWEQSTSAMEIFRAALGRRTGRDPDSFEIQVAAGTVLGALSTAVTQWATEPGAELPDLVVRALDLIESGLRL
jgi:hypothetical protein